MHTKQMKETYLLLLSSSSLLLLLTFLWLHLKMVIAIVKTILVEISFYRQLLQYFYPLFSVHCSIEVNRKEKWNRIEDKPFFQPYCDNYTNCC